MRNISEFKRALKLVIDNVSFDKDSTVQVFEANIRLLGALISAHLLITDSIAPFGDVKPSWYSRELLDLAQDLATRLLPAFENSNTGLPYPRVNLRHGVPNSKDCEWCLSHTCTAGAGSLLLEFGVLSRLVGNDFFIKCSFLFVCRLKPACGLIPDSKLVELRMQNKSKNIFNCKDITKYRFYFACRLIEVE